MKRYFLTSLPPKDKEIESGVSLAMCNFSRSLMSGGMFDRTFSILATFVRKRYKPDLDVEYICSVTRCWSWCPRNIAPILEQVKLFFKIEKGSSLWLYNMTTLSEILFLLLRWFKPTVRIYTIVLDFTPGAKHNNRLLKRINASDGLIVLADSPLFTHHNKICLPGIVPTENVLYPKVTQPIARRFLLSGALSERISQISKVLKVFSTLQGCELHITGVDNMNVFSEYRSFSNIYFHPKLSWDEYLALMHSCPFILSTRDIEAPENKCNFPSKIIEALNHNRIVVSTFSYSQLKDIRILKVGNDIREMQHDIAKILHMSDDDLEKYGNQSNLSYKLFSTSVWNKSIKNIESNLSSK